MFELSLAEDSTREDQEGLVDVGAAVVANAKASELMQPAQRAFDNPAPFPQAATVFGVPMRDGRSDPSLRESLVFPRREGKAWGPRSMSTLCLARDGFQFVGVRDSP